jgi:hypothetical protein
MITQKQKLIFKLLKQGHISEEEASLLLETQKEYVYISGGFSYTPQSPYPTNPYPYTVSSSGNYHISNSRI